jgi:hypothetical protein
MPMAILATIVNLFGVGYVHVDFMMGSCVVPTHVETVVALKKDYHHGYVPSQKVPP